MDLSQLINQELKKAMLAKEKVKLAVLRAIKSAILIEVTKEGGDGKLIKKKAFRFFRSYINKDWKLLKFITSKIEKSLLSKKKIRQKY